VLPDEASYRSELDRRIAAGQTVYLARFLPGLEGVYHLRSVGPLTEVSREPLAELPEGIEPASLAFGPIELRGYVVEPVSAVDGRQAAVTFYWQAQEPAEAVWLVYVRWANLWPLAGQHPANNYYPTVAWEVGEIVPDYHLLPRPVWSGPLALELQVALGRPFSRPEELMWQTVTTMELPPTDPDPVGGVPLRAQLGPLLLDRAAFAEQVRPGDVPSLTVTGYVVVDGMAALFAWLQQGEPSPPSEPLVPIVDSSAESRFSRELEYQAAVANGRYDLFVVAHRNEARCGWLAPVTSGCVVGEVEVSGVALPAGATNFADQIALLSVDIPQRELRPGGHLAVTLTWQSLTPIAENYTVFVQVLDENDRLVGQVDSWPVQGTYPTSQWPVGEVVEDRYQVQLAAELPPGQYRLQVGWYLLATLQRLPVVDEAGTAVEDKMIVSGLVRP
jgi:hypothetical protein